MYKFSIEEIVKSTKGKLLKGNLTEYLSTFPSIHQCFLSLLTSRKTFVH